MSPLEIAYLPRLKLYRPLGQLIQANTSTEKNMLPFAYKIWLYVKRSFKERNKCTTFSQHLKFIQQLNVLQMMLKKDNLHKNLQNPHSKTERTIKTMYLHDKIILQNYIKQRENEHKFYMENKEIYFNSKAKRYVLPETKDSPNMQALALLQEAGLAEPKDSIRFLCYSKKEHLSKAINNINKKLSESNIPFKVNSIQDDLVESIEFLTKHTSILSSPEK